MALAVALGTGAVALAGGAVAFEATGGHASAATVPAGQRVPARSVATPSSVPTPLDPPRPRLSARRGAAAARAGARAGRAAPPAGSSPAAVPTHPDVIAPPNPNPVRIAAPAGAPPAIAALVHGANLISGLPYRWGGGHQSLSDSAFDCSGSVSYALNWAGMLTGTRTSGQLAHWGVAGPGRWLTVYANAEHTFLVVRGRRFDTRGLRDPTNSRWQPSPAATTGYAARHWPGL